MHNLVICGRRTTVRLEDEMWEGLKEVAEREGCSVNALASRIYSQKKSDDNFSSAIRVFLMLYYRDAATESGPCKGWARRNPVTSQAKREKAALAAVSRRWLWNLKRKLTARCAPRTRMNGSECVNREGSTMASECDNLNVLVIADPLPLKTLLLPVLDTIGVKNILTAQDTREGFDLFRIHRPGLVLADWDMALLSGLDLTQMIRRAPLSPDYKTPVILLTGDETAGVRMTQARDAGVTQLLLKPFAASELIGAITHAMNPREFIIDFLTYIGPDRRQDVMPGYAGLPRRATDQKTQLGVRG
jgi:predicted DNA-binding ribbon-helix-helix protein/CheY-like chemotaxis protein